jgi:hypothetical protein
MAAHEPTASWVNPLVLEAERLREERDAVAADLEALGARARRLLAAAQVLSTAAHWTRNRAQDALSFADERRRPVSADFYRDVLQEIADELDRALERAHREETP